MKHTPLAHFYVIRHAKFERRLTAIEVITVDSTDRTLKERVAARKATRDRAVEAPIMRRSPAQPGSKSIPSLSIGSRV